MSTRRAKLVLLCEDRQHEVFIRRFLLKQGWDKYHIRIEMCPPGSQSAEQYVRDQFPKELSAYRRIRNKVSSSLAVIIDADTNTVEQRIQEFKEICDKMEVTPRTEEEKVALFFPRRNIETWIHYLKGEKVDEETDYLKLKRESDCEPQVERLSKMCNAGHLDGQPPQSLVMACSEYQERLL